jgi:RNA polymerase sigma factor (sigma-70 family)
MAIGSPAGDTFLNVDDDAALVAAWQGGDKTASGLLIERHYDAITRFFVGKASAAADDLTQRTFLVCAEAIATFRGQGSFRAFLFGIARNLLLEHIRGRVRDGQPDFEQCSLVDLTKGVFSLAAQRAELRLLGRALQHIPLELQILLELYYWEELGLDELAVMLGVPEGTIKSRLHRARTLLREAMAKVPASKEEQESAGQLLATWVAGMRAVSPNPRT